MAYPYPIWIDVTACIYNSSKSYGAKNTNTQRILVGSGPKNSELHCEIITTKRFKEHPKYGSVIVFMTSINNKILNISVFENTKKNTAGKFLYKKDHTKRLKGLKLNN
jgi:hypothetical protein